MGFLLFPILSSLSTAIGNAQENHSLSTAIEKFSFDFRGTDILDAFRIIASKSNGMNIITTPEVKGTVTVKLMDVTWDRALQAILEMNNLGYRRDNNIIIVAPLWKKNFFEATRPALETEVFDLKYIDAGYTQKALMQMISPQGKISILQVKSLEGWEFSGGKGESFTSIKRKTDDKQATIPSNTLVVTDTPEVIKKIRKVIGKIDIRPRQVLIETKIIEVNQDRLKDMGLDLGTGSSGAQTNFSFTPITQNGSESGALGGQSVSSLTSPFGFSPLGGSSGVPVSSVQPFNLGSQLAYQKLSGNQFEVVAHALEEDAQAKTLSSPRILALNNQEATILVGTKYPILQSNITGAGSVGITTATLDYYQDIGIELKVVPQLGADGDINMVIHPAVTSYTQTVGANAYPIILTREVETRVVMQDGETIVIGGLLSDQKTKSVSGVPGLMNIPLIGRLFKRETVDTSKTDLLIFITAKVIKEGHSYTDEITAAETRFKKD